MARSVAERADVLPLLAEVFRAHGYEGATLALISDATGLGKGSLYNFFPGGKEQMAMEVLTSIDRWFVDHVYTPLRTSADPARGIADMFAAVDGYFRSGQRVCLVGVVALGASRDPFGDKVKTYFVGWIDALAAALRRLGNDKTVARHKAEQAVLDIQGALVLTRALDDAKVFSRALAASQRRLLDTA
ncbi:TetR/AcrR family transcriptional regulator [Bradyrhizobium prioriisuperbiae]|uniref:TetR/AcrR family transcriptional regulator n=1 Tax=Bradyrhizobium prioriisuperbiae TaxID=2854389 RepID=UPI0028E85481|nr:TetR/AcrR family transcriptional regulator [Bradyrhizobium prioritasuperba]